MKHIPKENIKVSLSVGFLASLQERHNERYSKHEAFCYLLDKACEHYMPKAVSKDVADELKDFQFVTTKTQLAEDWHWHRATVRQFLEKLTEHGLIHCKEFETKYTIITMTSLKDDTVPEIAYWNQSSVSQWTVGSMALPPQKRLPLSVVRL